MTYRHKFQVLLAQYDNHKRSYWTGRAEDAADACYQAKRHVDSGKAHSIHFAHPPTPAFVAGIQDLGQTQNAAPDHNTEYGEGIELVPRRFSEAVVCGPVIQPLGEFGPNTLRQLRHEYALSQTALGQFLGYANANQVCAFETGQAAIPRLVKIGMAWVHFYGCNYPWRNVE